MRSSLSSDVCPCAPGPLASTFSCGPFPHGDETAKCAQRLGQRPSHDWCPNKAIEAEASDCATLRPNGTGSRATPWSFSCGPFPHGSETANCAQRLLQRPSHDWCSNKAIKAETSDCATLRLNGTGSRATPWFEGAQLLRRCSPDSKSEHLGKPRRFLRRCSPFSKVRTEKCAPSKTGVVMLKRLAHSCYPARGRRIQNKASPPIFLPAGGNKKSLPEATKNA